MWRHNLTIPQHRSYRKQNTLQENRADVGDILELQNVVTKVDVLVYENIVRAIVHVNAKVPMAAKSAENLLKLQ